MNHVLPSLTLNRSFITEFVTADAPCFALGLVEEQNRQCGFLALRPNEEIPPSVSGGGFNFGHTLFGTTTLEVIHFVFEFYGFQTYNVLVNPNNPLVQTVLKTMLSSGDYFFFALAPNSGHVTAFRSEVGQETLMNLKTNLSRIQNSMTTDSQYRQALSSFAKNPDPESVMLNWVCRDNIDYLDLTKDTMELTPA